jgi:hypothetical protein
MVQRAIFPHKFLQGQTLQERFICIDTYVQ